MSAAEMWFAAGMALLFAFCFANRPLWPTDLWDHVNYGRVILASGRIPQTEPLLATAVGSPMVCTAWAAQVAAALILDTAPLGFAGLQFVYGLLVVASVAVVGCSVLERTRSAVFAFAAAVGFLYINWQQFLIIRPQLVGVFFFSICVSVLWRRPSRRSRNWIMLPVLFALWANVHGSFAMGLTLMGLTAVGQLIDLWRRSRSLRLAVTSRRVRFAGILVALCAAASMLNPNGVRVYHEVLRIGGHPNISSMYEWKSLTLEMKQGQATVVVVSLVLILLCFTPRRIQFAKMLPAVCLLGLAIWSSRMLNWFAPVCGLLLGIHAGAIWKRWRGRRKSSSAVVRSEWYTVAAVAMGICCCLPTNLGQQVVAGKVWSARECLSSGTPVEAADFLAGNHEGTKGSAFVPAEWSGYVMYRAPQVRPIVNLHVHVLPTDLWSDYLRLLYGQADWKLLLNKHDISLVMTDRRRQRRLTQFLQLDEEFRVLFEDERAVVFVRNTP